MPFKGDMRLGGPHDNEARLNGTSEGPSVPSAGTVLQSGLTAPINVWASHPVDGQIEIQTGTSTYNVVADGLGGTINVVTSTSFVPEGTFIGPSFNPNPSYSEYDGYTYQNGQYVVSRYVSDGAGEYTIGEGVEVTGSFYESGTMVTGAPQYSIVDQYSVHPSDGISLVPNGKYSYDSFVWNGLGEIYMSVGQPFTGGEFYTDTTLQSDATDPTVEVPSGSYNYYYDGRDARYEWNGLGGIVLRYVGGYAPYGQYITNYGGYNYYWDGNGNFYSQYDSSSGGGGESGGGGGSSTPSYGTPTGSTASGDNWININGIDYYNGTYSGTQYYDGTNDGTGSYGTYWEYSYSYQPYGYQFTFTSYYDSETGSDVYTYYYSNGNGGWTNYLA